MNIHQRTTAGLKMGAMIANESYVKYPEACLMYAKLVMKRLSEEKEEVVYAWVSGELESFEIKRNSAWTFGIAVDLADRLGYFSG